MIGLQRCPRASIFAPRRKTSVDGVDAFLTAQTVAPGSMESVTPDSIIVTPFTYAEQSCPHPAQRPIRVGLVMFEGSVVPQGSGIPGAVCTCNAPWRGRTAGPERSAAESRRVEKVGGVQLAPARIAAWGPPSARQPADAPVTL